MPAGTGLILFKVEVLYLVSEPHQAREHYAGDKNERRKKKQKDK